MFPPSILVVAALLLAPAAVLSAPAAACSPCPPGTHRVAPCPLLQNSNLDQLPSEDTELSGSEDSPPLEQSSSSKDILRDTECVPCPDESFSAVSSWDTECTTCSHCAEGEFVLQSCSSTKDTVCHACTNCQQGYYPEQQCSESLDTVCSVCSACSAGEYLVQECSNTDDTVCASCSLCGEGEYQTQACTFLEDTQCKQCTVCTENQYRLDTCSDTADTICAECTVCDENQYAYDACTPDFDSTCRPCWFSPNEGNADYPAKCATWQPNLEQGHQDSDLAKDAFDQLQETQPESEKKHWSLLRGKGKIEDEDEAALAEEGLLLGGSASEDNIASGDEALWMGGSGEVDIDGLTTELMDATTENGTGIIVGMSVASAPVPTYAIVIAAVTSGLVFFFVGYFLNSWRYSNEEKQQTVYTPAPLSDNNLPPPIPMTALNVDHKGGDIDSDGDPDETSPLQPAVVAETSRPVMAPITEREEPQPESQARHQPIMTPNNQAHSQPSMTPNNQAHSQPSMVPNIQANSHPVNQPNTIPVTHTAIQPDSDPDTEADVFYEDVMDGVSTDTMSAGKYQSPIDINPDTASLDEMLEKHPLVMRYVPRNTKTITNTGTTIKVDVDGLGSVLKGGPLGLKTYQLDHFHFHWGSSDERGSEHTIKGKAYSAELHLVHWNAADYTDFLEACRSEDGLAVLSVFVEVGDKEHADMKVLTDCLASIQYKGESREVPGERGYDPAKLLPENLSDYWCYTGSITDAPYYENVTWIVFRQPISILPEQLQEFRKLLLYPREEAAFMHRRSQAFLVDNYRDTLPVEDRVVRASFL